MVLALCWALLVFLLMTTISVISEISSAQRTRDDYYKQHYRERHKMDIYSNKTIDDMLRLHRPARRNSVKGIPTFSRWSDWDECNRFSCTQSRNRICLRHIICHGSTQTETRSCSNDNCRTHDGHDKNQSKFSSKNSEQHILDKSGDYDYDRDRPEVESNIGIKMIRKKYNDLVNPSAFGIRNKQGNINRKPSMRIIRKSNPEMMLRTFLPIRTTRGYSKWSIWSPCSKQCLTIRKRKCMRRRVCGRNVIKETAYCYIENSNCQEWVRNKIQDSKTKFIFETISSSDMAEGANDVEQLNIIPHGDSRKENVHCGILYGNKSSIMRSHLWSMMRIIGGRPSPKGKWVWQVVILNRFKEAFCGGTLVSLRWVLTAAHCVRKRLYVRIGEYSLSIKDDYEVEMQIKEAVIHPLYNPETVDNDVAMLRLPQAARPDRGHGIVCLPHYRQPLPSGRLCTIIGWGKRRSTDHFGTDTLQEAEVPIIPMETCRNTYIDYYITNNMFCAGYRRGRMDSCAGDSGGPLLCKDPTKPGEPWTIYGITSFGDGCGKRGKYGIYTRLPNYVNWINKVLKITYFQD